MFQPDTISVDRDFAFLQKWFFQLSDKKAIPSSSATAIRKKEKLITTTTQQPQTGCHRNGC